MIFTLTASDALHVPQIQLTPVVPLLVGGGGVLGGGVLEGGVMVKLVVACARTVWPTTGVPMPFVGGGAKSE